MDICDRRGCKNAARRALSETSCDVGKLILFHTGVTLAVSLLCILAELILDQQISNTGGLSGMGTRSVLTTIQSTLQAAQSLLLPFWQVGYVFAVMGIARGERVDNGYLLEGFRRFFPVLRLQILTGLIYFGAVMVCGYAGVTLFLFTPFANALMEVDMTAFYETGDMNQLQAVISSADFWLPLVIILAALLLVVLVPLTYKFRLATYCLLDKPEKGALRAIQDSRLAMRYRAWDMLKLDLSFWWFYLLEALLVVVNYLDLILEGAGVTLPWSAEVGYVVVFVLYAVGQLALYRWRKNEVAVTYAVVYDTLKLQ